MPELGTVERHIRIATIDHQQARRFMRRATWAVLGVLGVMAACLWAAAFLRSMLSRAVANVIDAAFLGAFVGLILLVAVLWRRMTRLVDGLAVTQDMLLRQNERLHGQNEELEQQSLTLQEQAIELEMHAEELRAQTSELELSNRTLEESERQQHRQADELRLLARRLREAQRVAKLGYWELDVARGSVFFSQEMFRLCGLDPDNDAPRIECLLDLVHAEDLPRVREALRRSLEHLSEFSEQYRVCLPDTKTPRTVQATARVMDDGHGGQKLVGTVQDLSERLQLEAQLRQSQKMEAIGQLAGGVAHDFNNVLTVIEGYSSLLLASHPHDGPDRQYITEVRTAAQRAATLTRQLLTFSRKQDVRARVLNLNDAIEGITTMLHRLIGEDVELHAVLSPNLDPVTVDPGQVEQVLMNLAVNARDAMPAGGVLVIETANVTLDASYAQSHPVKRLGPHVMLAVTDTGIGMSAETQARIFEPFFTTKEAGKGTGLGLSTVYGIVNQAEGHIWVYSETGRGTSFKIYLPSAQEMLDAPVVAAAPHFAQSASGRILLVEDDAALRTLAATVLRSRGYEVIEVGNGREALEECERRKGDVDVIVSDMVMPGMNGHEVARAATERWPRIKIVLMSGYTPDAIARTGLGGRSDAVLEKPFTPETLAAAIGRVLSPPLTTLPVGSTGSSVSHL
jgi:signal transduction histidine kinase/ActR/RegA family two-component response regulator